jgi:site-specific recombinase XerD
MIKSMELRNLSKNTQRSYLRAVSGMAKHYKMSPHNISKDMAEDYLLYLKNVKRHAPNSVGTVVSGLRCLYKHVLSNKENAPDYSHRKTRKLPTVLAHEEVWQIINAPENLKHRLILMTIYSAGLRASEVIVLKPENIDSKRMLIKVEDGKGGKDRYTLLSERLLKELRPYYKIFQPKPHLFPSSYKDKRVLCYESVRSIYENAKNLISSPHPIRTRGCCVTKVCEVSTKMPKRKSALRKAQGLIHFVIMPSSKLCRAVL